MLCVPHQAVPWPQRILDVVTSHATMLSGLNGGQISACKTPSNLTRVPTCSPGAIVSAIHRRRSPNPPAWCEGHLSLLSVSAPEQCPALSPAQQLAVML